MSFFYDLNKKLDAIRETPSKTHGQLNERDEGKPGKNFAKIAKDAGERYGSKAAGERVAGAVRNKLKAQGKLEEAGQDFGSSAGVNFGPADPYRNPKNLAGPTGPSDPDFQNYKTPNMDRNFADPRSLDKIMGKEFAAKFGADLPQTRDARGQTKYVDRTAPGVINKIKDKLGLDMPDPAYGPRPDEREKLVKRYPAPGKSIDEGGEVIDGVYKLAIEPKRPEELENKMTRGTRPRSDKSNQIFPPMRLPSDEKFPPMRLPSDEKFPPMRLPKGDERVFPPMRLPTDESGGPAPAKPKSMVDKQVSKMNTPPPTRPNPAPKGEFMGTIKGGVWTADPPKKGERGVPAPSGDPEGVKEGGMTATRKFTFADKIARARREVDEMLGDVAAEAMRSALSPKQKGIAKLTGNPNEIDAGDLRALRKGRKPEMDEERSKGTAFDMSTRRVDTPKAGSTERGSKHDIKHSTSDPRYTGRTVTRRTDAQGISVGADDDSDTQAGPRGRGRPKGTKGSIGAKGPSGKSKLMTREGDQDIRDQGEYDQEGDMAKDDIKTIVRHAQALSRVLGDDDNLPEWVQSKLAKIEGMMISIDEYMQNQEDDEEEPIAEKAVSKKQQRFMGMVHAAQKGEKPASRAVSKVANTMKPKDTADFAKTKHKGLPEKKKKEVDENSEEGRITTTRTGPGKTLTTSSTGRVSATIGNGKMSVKPGKQDKPMDDDTDTASSSTKDTSKPNSMVGKGIYDSINLELENMIAESMSINMSDSTDGNKSLTITATDEDAMKLAMILKNAGLGGHGDDMHSHGEQACDTCGMQDCGCSDVDRAIDENAPDWPTNTETSNDALQYAGGLNKPKADIAGNGQSTVPVVATRPQNEEDALRRMMEMAGLAEAAKPDFLDLDGDNNKKESMKDAADDVNEEDTVEESIRRMREIAGIKEAKKANKDYDGDGHIESGADEHAGSVDKAIKKAQAEKKVDESIFALTNQWQAYKG